MHMSYFSGILADAPTTPVAAPAGGPGAQPTPMQTLLGSPIIMVVVLIVMMYFIMFRPQSQQRKRHAEMLKVLKSGDKVVTSAGIVGVVITVKDKTVSIRSADAKMEVTKASITEVLESSAATES
jgi:preprotein translocase subunit YajC